MAFTLRLPEDLQDAVRLVAEHEHKSQHDVVVDAVREKVESTARMARMRTILDRIDVEDHKLLEELAGL